MRSAIGLMAGAGQAAHHIAQLGLAGADIDGHAQYRVAHHQRIGTGSFGGTRHGRDIRGVRRELGPQGMTSLAAYRTQHLERILRRHGECPSVGLQVGAGDVGFDGRDLRQGQRRGGLCEERCRVGGNRSHHGGVETRVRR